MEKNIKEKFKIESLYLLIYDIVASNLSYFLALFLRFDLKFSQIPEEYLMPYIKFIPIYTVFLVIVFHFFRLYNSLWKYASFGELNRILLSTLITSVFHILGITILFNRMPVSYYVIGALLQLIAITGIRFSYRFVTLLRDTKEIKTKSESNVMIIGAGQAGQVIIRELIHSDKLSSKPVCIIDDNKDKWGYYFLNIPIVGGRDKILQAAEKYKVDKIMFAIPSASSKDKKDILNICKETKCELLSLPGIYQLANGEVSLNNMKNVAIEDLLGREPIKVNMDEIFADTNGKTILVTGGGGTIGSELCRQLALHAPKRIIIFDIYENNAYDIEQELRRKYPKLDLIVLIGSVRDYRRVDMIFEKYRPELVYHAAAHKHVPLMENSPNETIKNNVVGTYNTAFAALKYHTKKFVLISTDKAVNPTNIMGASKRICEMIMQSFDQVIKEDKFDLLPYLDVNKDNAFLKVLEDDKDTYNTQFVAVRFGNVLGSSGSVIPLFKKQIAEGGPVTVTDPEIVRFFMTIPEAVSLVLQAGRYAKGGEIFILDMGEPVKIDTLARNLIKLSGYEPDVDIKIKYIGLRPGEKMYEEKLMDEEGLKKTENDLIHIGRPIEFDLEEFLTLLKEASDLSVENTDKIYDLVKRMIKTYNRK
ncbi:MAG: nucleoside-diphosphate sugar epimerase/dehydratase [Peptoniphilaceae bacterium]|nr:nucleoside-diphosphate sugar epimerase/dehydratase [Peptoniphilaceae bacterium]MDY6018305.1 nucleoside-diphosphate sugar epimerase/dehydratase [Anaerococcus sp.]